MCSVRVYKQRPQTKHIGPGIIGQLELVCRLVLGGFTKKFLISSLSI